MVDYASKRIVFTMNFVNASLNGKIILCRYFFISIVIFSSTHRSLVWSVASGDRSFVCTWTISQFSRNRCDDVYEDFIKSFLENCAKGLLFAYAGRAFAHPWMKLHNITDPIILSRDYLRFLLSSSSSLLATPDFINVNHTNCAHTYTPLDCISLANENA